MKAMRKRDRSLIMFYKVLFLVLTCGLLWHIKGDENRNSSHMKFTTDLSVEISADPSFIAPIGYNADFRLSFDKKIDPYFGLMTGISINGLYAAATGGIEQTYSFGDHWYFTPSIGVHGGALGSILSLFDIWPYIGVHTNAKLMFSRKAFSAYYLSGFKYTYGFGPVIPLGFGISIKF